MASFISENCGTPVSFNDAYAPSAPRVQQFHQYIPAAPTYVEGFEPSAPPAPRPAVPSAPPTPLCYVEGFEPSAPLAPRPAVPSAPPMPSAWVPTPPSSPPPKENESRPSAPPSYEETMRETSAPQKTNRSNRGCGILKKSWKRVPSLFAAMKEATTVLQKLCQENLSFTESMVEKILRQTVIPEKNNRVLFKEEMPLFPLLKTECVANRLFLMRDTSMDNRMFLSLIQHGTVCLPAKFLGIYDSTSYRPMLIL